MPTPIMWQRRMTFSLVFFFFSFIFIPLGGLLLFPSSPKFAMTSYPSIRSLLLYLDHPVRLLCVCDERPASVCNDLSSFLDSCRLLPFFDLHFSLSSFPPLSRLELSSHIHFFYMQIHESRALRLDWQRRFDLSSLFLSFSGLWRTSGYVQSTLRYLNKGPSTAINQSIHSSAANLVSLLLIA